ncbi:MAG: hypothetical protein JWO73_533 [Candidatus Taylorbacteria bacterium]|nr:hypothetical protein [Candidatus Taylorbacteria bacterium]
MSGIVIILAMAGYSVRNDFRMPGGASFEKASMSIAPIENPKSNFQYFQFVLPDSNKNIVQCDKYADFELNAQCYQSLALLRKDASYCDSIGASFETGSMHRNDCYNRVAAATGNASLCTDDGCITSIGKDVSKCPPLGQRYNGSYECYLDIAVSTKNPSVCELLGNDKDSMLTCYEYVAEAKQDSSICEMGNPTSEQKDDCYRNLSRTQNQNMALCEKISNKEFRDSCKYRIVRGAAVREGNVGACNNLSSDQSRINDCLEKVAYRRNDPLLCELIKDDEYELSTNQCVLRSSPAMLEPSRCDGLKDTHYGTADRDLCYFQYARVNQKPAICQKIGESGFRDKCLKEKR